MMTKFDMFWIATASAIYPATDFSELVSLKQICEKYLQLFGEASTPSLEQQLISWKRRYVDKNNVLRGGSSKRYVFRTKDGVNPDAYGRFRLYKLGDVSHDGEGKIGSSCPVKDNVSGEFSFLIDWYKEKYLPVIVETTRNGSVDAALERTLLLVPDLSSTQTATLTLARRGQAIFKARVARIEPFCRLTGVTETHFLVASHIKPWAVANAFERLDGHNGLLLAPHADWLFDSGFITFNQDGSVQVAVEGKRVWQQWKLSESILKPLTQQQEDYMRYHRDHVFRCT